MKEEKIIKNDICGDKKQRCKTLIIDGTKYRTLYNRKFENRKQYKIHDPNKIVSFIPGTVMKLFVSEGQAVNKGDSILILDAMKMKNRLVFHKSGVVKSIHVAEGEKVPKDFLMIELDPSVS